MGLNSEIKKYVREEIGEREVQLSSEE